MKFGSVCSGIEAPSEAWIPLGWEPKFVSEIDPFCCALLKQKHPNVRNYGDFTTIGSDAGPIDVLVGGTPCQDFSVAGLRAGMAGERGNLTLEFLRLAQRLRPQWLVWENVPGVLSSVTHDAPDSRPPEIDLDTRDGPKDGEEIVVEDEYDADENHAFASFLAGLQELGYGFAYGVLDAQYFGVPQRRRRVFVVGYLGDWRPAAAVLFEPESVLGDASAGYPQAGKGTGEHVAYAVSSKWVKGSGGPAGDEFYNLVPVPLWIPCACCEEFICTVHGTHAFECECPSIDEIDFDPYSSGNLRKYTPRECERLQGFSDDFTAVTYRGKPAADGPRYKALGNSMAVPVMRWIGERIDLVAKLLN